MVIHASVSCVLNATGHLEVAWPLSAMRMGRPTFQLEMYLKIETCNAERNREVSVCFIYEGQFLEDWHIRDRTQTQD